MSADLLMFRRGKIQAVRYLLEEVAKSLPTEVKAEIRKANYFINKAERMLDEQSQAPGPSQKGQP